MQVKIKTPSRIHLGLIDLNGELGRLYGSIGLALNEPSIVVEARESDSLKIKGEDSNRVRSVVESFSKAYGVSTDVEIDVKQTIPEHIGLGSGTQLSLAVASALAQLNKMSVGVWELARATRRGTVSGIGVEAFRKGGFIIDAGKKTAKVEDVPFAIYRRDFPEDWTIILAIPPEKRGISGPAEESAFEKVIPAPPEIAKDICRLLQMKLLPSLVEKDLETFGQALMEVDRKVGLYFSEVQDGVYAEPLTHETIGCMLEAGAHGAGQSSWGPAAYGIVEDGRAKDVESALKTFFEEKGVDATILRAHANNSGAETSLMDEGE